MKKIGNPSTAITLAMSGASGIPYGLRLLDCLIAAGQTVYFMLSPAAEMVVAMETELKLPKSPAKLQTYLTEKTLAQPDQIQVFGANDWTAPIASGSSAPRAMVVCPCSSGFVAAVATGASNNLLERAADVVIKENRKLILVPRETPLSAIHLENMLKLARLGVVILPPSPGFYHQPQSIDDLVNFVVARILDQLEIPLDIYPRWNALEGL